MRTNRRGALNVDAVTGILVFIGVLTASGAFTSKSPATDKQAAAAHLSGNSAQQDPQPCAHAEPIYRDLSVPYRPATRDPAESAKIHRHE
jgi:hypothetical protein